MKALAFGGELRILHFNCRATVLLGHEEFCFLKGPGLLGPTQAECTPMCRFQGWFRAFRKSADVPWCLTRASSGQQSCPYTAIGTLGTEPGAGRGEGRQTPNMIQSFKCVLETGNRIYKSPYKMLLFSTKQKYKLDFLVSNLIRIN